MATRDLTNDFITEITAASLRPAFFVKIVFPDLTLRLCTLQQHTTLLSESYLSNGWITSISPDQENNDLRAANISIELSGVTPEVISTILNSANLATYCQLYFVVCDADWQPINDPYLLFKGVLSVPTISESGIGSTVSLNFESELINKKRRKEHRYTDEGQKIFYPDDKGFQYIPQANKWSGFWGSGKNPLNVQRRGRR